VGQGTRQAMPKALRSDAQALSGQRKALSRH